jgi:outer membrane protein TolC
VRLESVSLRESQRDRAQTLFDVGSVAKNDVLQARVNLQQARLEEIQARNQVEVERARLAELMGISIIAEYAIVDDMVPEPAAAIDSMAVWNEAQQNRPDLKSAQLRMRASELGLSSARAGRYPNVFARYQQYWGNRANTTIAPPPSDPNQGTSESEPRSWGFVAGISWDIFDGMLTEGRVKQAKAEKIASENEVLKTQRTVALEIKEAILLIREAQQSITAAEVAVALAEDNQVLAEERYRLGSGTLIELEQAQVNLIDARRTLVEAQAALKVAEAGLDKARGRRYQ